MTVIGVRAHRFWVRRIHVVVSGEIAQREVVPADMLESVADVSFILGARERRTDERMKLMAMYSCVRESHVPGSLPAGLLPPSRLPPDELLLTANAGVPMTPSMPSVAVSSSTSTFPNNSGVVPKTSSSCPFGVVNCTGTLLSRLPGVPRR